MDKRGLLAAALLTAATMVPVVSTAGIGDIKIENQAVSRQKAGMGPVIFPHARHEKAFKCADCHPKIFKDKRGANPINMKANMDGKFCGSPNCHNSPKAFPLYQCTKCHTTAKK